MTPHEIRADRRALAMTVLLSIAVVIAIAVPVVRDPGTQIFGGELVGRHHDPFTVMMQYEAAQVPPPYLQPATDLPGIALAKATGAVRGYNLLVLVSFPLAALFAYLHAQYVTGSRVASSVAALLFALSPFHLGHATYHVHIAQIQWIPLFFWLLWRLLDRPTAARAVALTGALALVIASSFYLGFVTATIAPVAALAHVAFCNRGGPRRPSGLAWTFAGIGTALIATAIALAIASPQLVRDRFAVGFPLEALDQHSARWWSYLLPPLAHPWLGAIANGIWRAVGIDEGRLEQQVSLGVAAIALAAVALAAGFSTRDHPVARVGMTPVLATMAIAALLCSLPPTLMIGSMAVPMPSRVFYAIVPVFRAYARFGVLVSLAITTLAGAGLARLLAERSKTARAIAAALLALAIVEYAPRIPWSRDVLPTSAHRQLAGAADVHLLDCTTPTPGATAGIDWLMKGRVISSVGPLSDCAEPDLGSKLAAFQLTHLLVRPDSPVASWIASGNAPDGTRPLQVARDAAVFQTIAPRPTVYTTELQDFYAREFLGNDSWRWMGPAGRMNVVNATSSAVSARLEIELESLARTRQLTIDLDSTYVATLRVSPERRIFQVNPLVLAPGSHAITFIADATSAPGPTDPRPLSVRLRGWKWIAN